MGEKNGDTSVGEHMTIETVLPDILNKYHVQTEKDLRCDKLTDEDFELIGDAAMENIHPGEAHEQMDEMMGGKESESLKAMHIQMGRNYLGCSDEGYFGMGSGMMEKSHGSSMMGWGRTTGVSVIWGIGHLVAYIAGLSFLITGTLFFWKKIKK